MFSIFRISADSAQQSNAELIARIHHPPYAKDFGTSLPEKSTMMYIITTDRTNIPTKPVRIVL